MSKSRLHDFELSRLSGGPLRLSEYKGKVLLIVNVASECGFTPQYGALEELHQKYAAKGLVVLGVPANEFGAQEPGSNQQIADFCESKYGVTFPMSEKIVVKGPGQHPLYAFLTTEKGDVTWNFNKFLIDRQGNVVARLESKVAPLSDELTAAIDALL